MIDHRSHIILADWLSGPFYILLFEITVFLMILSLFFLAMYCD